MRRHQLRVPGCQLGLLCTSCGCTSAIAISASALALTTPALAFPPAALAFAPATDSALAAAERHGGATN